MAASDDLKQIEKLIADPKVRASNRATWNGKTYTLADLIVLRDETKQAVADAQAAETRRLGEEQAARRAAQKEQAATAQQIRGLAAAVKTANGNLNIAIDRGGDVVAAQKVLSAAIESLRKVDPTNPLIPEGAVAPAGRTVAAPRATAGMRGEGMGATETPVVEPQTVSTPTVTPTKTTTKTVTKTPGGGKNKVAKQGKVDVTADAWMEQFRKDYPAYSDWTTQSVIDYFGQDFVDVLMKAVDPAVEYSDEEIKALIKQTKYYNQTTGKQQEFDIARPAVQQQLLADARRTITSQFADLGLTETDLTDLSRKVARNGLSGTGLKQEVYQYAFNRQVGAPETPAITKNVLQSADADNIRRSAKAYGYRVSDAELQAALTGGMYNGVASSADAVLQKAQRAAKGAYSQLADQIDAGLSLDDIFSNYRSYAANLLEVDPNTIDYVRDPKWAEAFGTKDGGQMSISEWTTKIKSDPRFGWQFTKQANDQATQTALGIARAFGKVQ